MKYEINKYGIAKSCISSFSPVNGVVEHHVIITCHDDEASFETQLDALTDAFCDISSRLAPATCVTARCYVSDPVNQTAAIQSVLGTISVGQAPLSGTKVALWASFMTDMNLEYKDDTTAVYSHGAYKHIFSDLKAQPGDNSYAQTVKLFGDLRAVMTEQKGSLADNCMRTWIYVRDIDRHYAGMVRARNEVFEASGLRRDTHFIASTGIGATMDSADTLVRMSAYSLFGQHPDQVKYLSAPDHLNPTIEYGVAFERATSIDYGDRRHVFVSGTASINSRGEILHIGDIEAQGRRAVENVGALLAAAECSYDDIASAIVYLRDTADYHKVKTLMDEILPGVPMVIVHGAVCRPGWLFEIECIAIKEIASDYNPL